jgi:predicted nucleic acid-binding protein
MSNIYWDSCIFIYYLEANEDIRLKLRAQLSATPDAVVCHTALTELECRVEPLRNGKHDLLTQYDRLFTSPATRRLVLNDAVYRFATELRAVQGLKTPDALHLAAAIEHGCDGFWTRDNHLARAAEGRIQLMVPIEL